MKWNPPFQMEMKTVGFAMLHPPYYFQSGPSQQIAMQQRAGGQKYVGKRSLYYMFTLPARLLNHRASAREASAKPPTIASFSADVVFTATVVRATTGDSPALTNGLRAGWSSIKSASGGLLL